MNSLLHTVCLIGLWTSTAVAAGGGLPRVVPVDGEPFGGRLVAVDAEWQLTFDADGQRRVLPAAEVVCWGACVEVARGPIVVLADGGLLVADILRADRENLSVYSELFGRLKLPLDALAGVVFRLPAGRRQRDLLVDRVARATGRSDRLLLSNGDAITGLVDRIHRDTVIMETDAGELEVGTGRVAALIFNPDLKRGGGSTGLRAWAGFADGSVLMAGGLLIDGSSLQVTTVGGQTWKTSSEEFVWVQPLGGRASYLSDLKTAGYRHVPFLTLSWPYHEDRNVMGGRLRCGGRLYAKGLGMHSAARLTYLLDKPYKRFEAELGVDDSVIDDSADSDSAANDSSVGDSVAGGGSVRFRVFVDGRQRYASETIRGGMAPVPVSVDVAGAKRLDLIVDYAERGDVLDHADWLNARLVE